MTDRPVLIACPVWGEPGCALVPRALRIGWAELRVPAELEDAVGLAPMYWTDFGPEIWSRTTSNSEHIRIAVENAVRLMFFDRNAWAAVANLPVVGLTPPPGFDLRRLPLKVRTLNAILLANRQRKDLIQGFTVEQVSNLRNIGVVSILDFGCTTESALSVVSGAEHIPATTADIQELRRRYKTNAWANRVCSRDPRFASVLGGRLDGPLPTLPDQLPAIRLEAIETALERCRPIADAIEGSGLKAQLADYMNALGGMAKSEMSSAVLARFGMAGKAPFTLQKAAEIVGVTRERIRQVETKYLKAQRKAQARPFMPALEMALVLLGEWAPIPTQEAVSRLGSQGIGARHFSVESILSAAAFLGFEPHVELIETEGASIVVKAAASQASRNAMRQIALKIRSHARRGIANVAEVHEALGGQGRPLSLELVKTLIPAVPGIRTNGDWFWDLTRADNGRNIIVNLSCKMLTINSPISLQTMREGMRRHERYRGRAAPPPLAVLEAFYRSRPEFQVDDQHRVTTSMDLTSGAYTSPIEEEMVRILRGAPDALMDRNTFVEACHAANINLNTVSLFTTYNPCLERVAPNVWAPRGTVVSPLVLDEFRREHGWRNSPSNDVETGWDVDGRPWWTFRVTGTLLAAGGAATVPPAVRPILGRDYECYTDSGRRCGEIHASSGSPFVWGWGPFFSIAGVDVGDYVRTKFDIGKRKALVEVGGSELLEAHPTPAPQQQELASDRADLASTPPA